MKENYADYHELEFAVRSESHKRKPSTLASKLGRVLHNLVESIVAVNELKIYSFRSRSGSAYWTIHDQILGRRVFFDSEQEVRAWLDKRYYR
ncbi:hypothetical protein [Leptolyngbya ohadii]|uniref:hypothetical protein n=1 Tax=Leptolyngbya ohadii TaxID=1962290 RepID=UPI000B59CB60|nr:hypothetical protein [Leptolyngbya ohadii]